jgi:hypothetical protein
MIAIDLMRTPMTKSKSGTPDRQVKKAWVSAVEQVERLTDGQIKGWFDEVCALAPPDETITIIREHLLYVATCMDDLARYSRSPWLGVSEETAATARKLLRQLKNDITRAKAEKAACKHPEFARGWEEGINDEWDAVDALERLERHRAKNPFTWHFHARTLVNFIGGDTRLNTMRQSFRQSHDPSGMRDEFISLALKAMGIDISAYAVDSALRNRRGGQKKPIKMSCD